MAKKADIFLNHFRVRLSLFPSLDELIVEVQMEIEVTFYTNKVDKICKGMTGGNFPGHDVLSFEDLRYAGQDLPIVLAILFNLCISFSYLPSEVMRTVVGPIVKNKPSDHSHKNNYKTISLVTKAKMFDRLPNSHVGSHIRLHGNRFAFRRVLLFGSTAILFLKLTVKYYSKRYLRLFYRPVQGFLPVFLQYITAKTN